MRLSILALLPLVSCTSSRVAPIPDPLPVAGDWEVAASQGSFLGLEVRENDSGTLDDLSFEPGVRITRVIENSPASSAGLQTGDVLLAINGVELIDAESVAALLFTVEPGTPLALEVLRDDTAWRLEVMATERIGSADARPEFLFLLDPQRSRAGWRTGSRGARLVASLPDAPFPLAGVEVGASVSSVEGEPTRTARALLEALQSREAGETVEVEFIDQSGATRKARVRLFEPASQITQVSVPVLFHYENALDGDDSKFVLLDLWILSLFRYERQGSERTWTLLSLFSFAAGLGELEE